MLFAPIAQTFSLVPTSNDSAVPTSRCVATDRMAPWREPNAAMRCGHGVRFYGCELTFPTNA